MTDVFLPMGRRNPGGAWRHYREQLDNRSATKTSRILSDYLGDGLESLNCPIAPEKAVVNGGLWSGYIGYLHYWNTPGAASFANRSIGTQQTKGIVYHHDTGVLQEDSDGNPISQLLTGRLQTASWFYGHTGGQLRKLGQTWVHRNGNLEKGRYNLLLSDFISFGGGWAGGVRTNHHELRHDVIELQRGNDGPFYWWGTPKRSYNWIPTGGFFTGTDGHVEQHRLPSFSGGNYSSWSDMAMVGIHPVPMSFREE